MSLQHKCKVNCFASSSCVTMWTKNRTGGSPNILMCTKPVWETFSSDLDTATCIFGAAIISTASNYTSYNTQQIVLSDNSFLYLINWAYSVTIAMWDYYARLLQSFHSKFAKLHDPLAQFCTFRTLWWFWWHFIQTFKNFAHAAGYMFINVLQKIRYKILTTC